MAKTVASTPESDQMAVTEVSGTTRNDNGMAKLVLGWQQKQGFGTKDGVQDGAQDVAQTPAKRIRELRLGTAGLAQGLATSTKLKLDENEVVMRTVKGMKSACGFQRLRFLNPKRKCQE